MASPAKKHTHPTLTRRMKRDEDNSIALHKRVLRVEARLKQLERHNAVAARGYALQSEALLRMNAVLTNIILSLEAGNGSRPPAPRSKELTTH